ncbi:ATP-binding protein [Sandaracinus amylolyticus]|uniref:histidine kinase n=1 Tax=Sandaracinus amylolyticus TaxID=927083 RepID=A0A0F6YLP0_9BACT|nr:ATP-binding protein [Sandaracinus amylolyticus]AKF10101.1 Chemotaxis protein methyltransferase CheR [Sandaracinus amylolyticus]
MADGARTEECLAGGGEMGARMRAVDWSRTPLGPVERWPQSLRTSVSTCLSSRFPILVWWGPELVKLYNDAYAEILGDKHPRALGRPGREVWPEIWHIIGPMLATVVERGEGTWAEDEMLPMNRHGFVEETYFTFSYSPIRDESGGIGGVFTAVQETTAKVLGERRLGTLRTLAKVVGTATSPIDACERTARALVPASADVPFALFYLSAPDGRSARLAAQVGIDSIACAEEIALEGESTPWPLARAAREGLVVVHGEALNGLGPLPGGPWPEPATCVVVLPLATPGGAGPQGFVVAGCSPRIALDDRYRGFFSLLADQVATALDHARAAEAARRRAEELAELDRLKTTFFSNASHELRTPLTLILAPLEDAMRAPPGRLEGDSLASVHRNALRLLRLVNSLLDFARIEAGRARASFEPLDLAQVTTDLASAFRGPIERGGLALEVDCPPLSQPVWVDADLWEKVVLNLLSNAFKFTFDGRITVRMRERGERIVLEVSDTGGGIPPHEVPQLFQRFHRVEGTRSRTHEGTGIGLALVHELVHLHGGTIGVESTLGRGTTFTVTLRAGHAHLPADRVSSPHALQSTRIGARPFVEEAERWLPEPEPERVATPAPGTKARVLIADDNADMRAYLTRLLSPSFDVQCVEDGARALEAMRVAVPDVLVSDVMMPGVDGLGLVRAVRADPTLAALPVVLLSARAGEESRVDGMGAGADDYVVKPFSGRELVARVRAHVQLGRTRRALAQELAESEELFRVSQEISPLGFSYFAPVRDPSGAILDFELLYQNGAAARLNGLPSGRHDPPISLRETVPTLPTSERWQGYLSVAETGVTWQRELHYESPSFAGWVRVTLVRPRPDAIALIAEDVTARRAIEDERARLLEREREHSARLRGLAEAALDIVGSGTIEALLRITAERARALVPSHQAIAIVASDLDGGPPTRAVSRSEEHALAAGTDDSSVDELDALVRDTNRPVRLSHAELVAHPSFRDAERAPRMRGWLAAPLVGSDGRNLGLLQLTHRSAGEFTGEDEAVLVQLAGVASIALENARLYELAQGERRRAEDANRLKDEFLATMSHELRTPLNAMLGWARMLRSGALPESKRAHALETIERNVRIQTALIEDVLDVARISTGKLRLDAAPLDIAQVVQAAVEIVRPAAESKGIALDVTLGGACRTMGDATRLQQIVWNLLTNAVKFTPRGGHVVVTMRRVVIDGGAAHVEIAVQDSGQGIPHEFLPHVFERFRQADASSTRKHGGLGLGLSVVKHLVELHGGSVHAESEGEARGARFVVRIPIVPLRSMPAGVVATERPRVELETSELTRLPELAGIRVLLVEDEPDTRDVLRAILEHCGMPVTATSSADDALAAFDAARPDVLVSDIGMPGTDGYELIRTLRERDDDRARRVPALALTAFASEGDRRRALEAGFQLHLSKPVEPAELVAAIARLRGAR